ncbi:MAG: replicative helicase loader/inhibitor [Clostridiales bacterium]|nr:replicative helicase loader/inhibitor [Clostridiales bacterium]
MKKVEIVKLLAILNTAFPNMQISDATVSLWYELLGDIDFIIAQAAIKKLLLESPYPPAIADVRKQITEIMAPKNGLEPAQAWGEVISAVQHFGFYREEEAIKSLNPTVAKVVKYMSWREICLSEEPGVVRGQFLKMYEQVRKREQQDALLPENLKSIIAKIAERHDLKMIEGGKE